MFDIGYMNAKWVRERECEYKIERKKKKQKPVETMGFERSGIGEHEKTRAPKKKRRKFSLFFSN